MSVDTSQYQICGYEVTPWHKIFPDFTAGYTTTLIGIYLGKLNTFILTRLQFLQYLNFFSSYSDDYRIMYQNYKDYFTTINKSVDKYISDDGKEKAFNDIEMKFKDFVTQHYKDVGSKKKLQIVYDLFFQNYEFFVGCKKGYSVKWSVGSKNFFANVPGTKYPKVSNPDFNYVEFSSYSSQKDNLRLFPLIESDTNHLRLVMFSNNKFIENLEMLTINSSTLTPSYQLSVNTIDCLSFQSINTIDDDKIAMKETSTIKYFFHNGNLYPNSNKNDKQTGILTLIKEKSNEAMIGKNLFDDDFEIN